MDVVKFRRRTLTAARRLEAEGLGKTAAALLEVHADTFHPSDAGQETTEYKQKSVTLEIRSQIS